MSEVEQCRALTEGGERCSRPAQDDGFCHQHDSSDETIDSADESADSDDGQKDDTQNDGDEHEENDVSQETEESDEETEQESAAQNGEFDVMAVRGTIEDVASDLVGHPLDGIIEISEDDDGWQVVVEMVERSSIPDTQDILGQYAVSLDESGNVTGYRLRERYRRGDDREQ
ncbi:Gas vesicle synthesis protein GvpO [Haladaptatus litoreus]|uniref:Gas vesicle synthesis protein GvpO n=1 Tax=Haladaptatus litoreus TaxID=553468 RepID=A0A1N6YIX6_9EURY|nr:gas vesicle protein [Haladaptatus litoreus]SIR14426.1 Gas vesicle synthesis protein GvpO [Haladaptatus litoreus]